ncbi:hypothetical protein M513_00261 [Trichuris suis]|uniref:Uncharacterized protein n=1 Tax=Trichuris suis TaxID=68888 RepID=A0A085MPF2_9BILA|nr:hypothetical protein M513_00261 [Trichuris suis]
MAVSCQKLKFSARETSAESFVLARSFEAVFLKVRAVNAPCERFGALAPLNSDWPISSALIGWKGGPGGSRVGHLGKAFPSVSNTYVLTREPTTPRSSLPANQRARNWLIPDPRTHLPMHFNTMAHVGHVPPKRPLGDLRPPGLQKRTPVGHMPHRENHWFEEYMLY